MNNIKAKDLIQAKALGCLDPDDDAMINKLMEEDVEFPWQELGQYQNLVAFLPTLLDIESPDQYVKDNIAKKLSQMEAERKAAEAPPPPPEPEPEPEPIQEPESEPKPESETVPEESETINHTEQSVEEELSEDITNLDPDIKIDEKIEGKVKGVEKKEISFKEHGAPQIPSVEEDDKKEKVPEEKQEVKKEAPQLKPDRTNRGPTQRLSRKEFESRNVKSFVSKTPAVEEKLEVQIKKDKAGIITAIVLFIITLLVLAFMYFKFSNEIQQNKEEINRLKNMISYENTFREFNLHSDFS
jgi:hypothetical protein